MSKATARYFYSTLHPRKPIRVEVTVESGDDSYVLDIRGRFPNQREASLVARDIICRYEECEEKFGRIV